jgi:hypothetical protein
MGPQDILILQISCGVHGISEYCGYPVGPQDILILQISCGAHRISEYCKYPVGTTGYLNTANILWSPQDIRRLQKSEIS